MKIASIAVAVSAVALSAVGGEIVVSPDGLSPEQAIEAVRKAKKAGDASAWTVHVKPGRYVLPETLVFLPEDSGTPEAPVTWVGEDGAEISGGEKIEGWVDEGNGVWSAPIPTTPDDEPAYFEQLWVNGRRADRARYPDGDKYLNVVSPKIEKVKDVPGGYVETVVFTNDAVKSVLASISAEDMPYAQMCVVLKWTFARRVLRGFDAKTGTVTTWSWSGWPGWQGWNEKETLVAFENVRAAFDAPGEWFYDVKNKKISYRPLPGEEIATLDAVAASTRLSKLVEFRGNPDTGAYVHDIRFRNIAFTYSASTGGKNAPTENLNGQAAVDNDATVTLTGVRRIDFKGCFVRHTGNYAMHFADGCTSNRVAECTLEDLGAGGIRMGADIGYLPAGQQMSRRVIRGLAPRSTAFNLIRDCTIRHGGRFELEGTGIALTHASDCTVVHCDIYDFYYTGISVGWSWGWRGSVAQRNEIAFNRIYDLGKGIMSDQAGIYTLGTSFGTRIHDNIVHDVNSYSYGGCGLYTDEGSEGIVFERNLVWNTMDASFMQHYGAGNVIRNNIFAWNREFGAIRSGCTEWTVRTSFHFVNNIVIVREGPLTSPALHVIDGIWAHNVWWNSAGTGKFLGGEWYWDDWKNCGKDIGSVYADPQFENADAYDFRLKPTSPALALGFKPWDMTKAGSRTAGTSGTPPSATRK